MSGPRTTRVLLIEDEPADIEFTQYAFDRGTLNHQLHVCRSGQLALDFLQRSAGTDDFPELILLDVNLPDVTGIDLLQQIRGLPSSLLTPVVVLSTSNYGADVLAAYTQQANAYVQKPLRLTEFENLVRTIEEFWFGQAILPSDH